MPRYLCLSRCAASLGCLSLVKIPFLLPTTRLISCFVMKSENTQGISPRNLHQSQLSGAVT